MDSPPTKTKLPAVSATRGDGPGATGAGTNILRSSSSGKNTHKKLAPLEDVPNPQLSSSLSSTKSITHKKDLMEALRKTNPAGVTTAPVIFWDVEGALKTTMIDDSDVKQQMNIVENGVNYSVKRYNDLRVINERLVRDLKARLDELEYQKKSFESLDSMKNATTDEGIQIETLKKEITQCEDEIRDRTHYVRKLDHMLSRLKSNQLKFDAHMVGMEDTMRAIQKDGNEVRLMRRGLDAGLAKAILVFEETKSMLAVARKDREVLMEQRKLEFRNALVLEDWLKERERMKIELGIELRGDLTMEEEKFLRSQIDEKMEKTKSLQKATEEGLKKLQSMEEAFTKLKQVTGVKNVEEMHEKFSNQKSNKLQLELEVKDAEHRLAGAKKVLNKLETQFQELKSSGIGLQEINRDSIKKLEELFSEARNEQKAIRADSERVASVLLGLHQGAQGLLQRVHPYLSLTEGGVFELTQLGEDTSPWTETVDALTTGEHVLSKMMEAIAGDQASSNPGGYDENGEEDDHSAYSRDSQSLDSYEEAPNQSMNVRIKSKRFIRDLDVEDEPNLVVAGGDNLDNEVHIEASMKEKEKEKEKDDVDDPNVLSRVVVKKISARRSVDEKRKEDVASRRKKLLDKIDGKPAPVVDLSHVSESRAQRAAADRMCTTKAVPTLPEGVTLRDDAMTKTNAFLTSLPKLT